MTEQFARASLCVDAFPKDGQFWRLDWIGDVFRPRHLSRDDRFVRLSLSRVMPDAKGGWSYPENPIVGEQISVAVRLGMLPMLYIGSIWKDGQLAIDPDYQTETFYIEANGQINRIMRAGTPHDDFGYILPFTAHPYHRGHTQSYCLRVERGDDVLLLPAMEMIRSYFGSSTNLLRRLFDVPFNDAKLWTSKRQTPDGYAHITLAKGLSGASASDVARIAFDASAYHAASLISKSLMVASVNHEPLYPKFHFPFSGESLLKVKGVWLPGVMPKTFLAFQILSCTHPFPFSRLHYEMSRNQARKDRTQHEAGAAQKEGAAEKRSGAIVKSPTNVLINKDPNGAISQREAFLSYSIRFPDLVPKKISRVDPEVPVTVIAGQPGGVVEGLSAGHDGSNKGIRPVDLIRPMDAPEPSRHPMHATPYGKFVSDFVERLQQDGLLVWYVALSDKQRYPQFSKMPRMVIEEGEIHPLSFVATSNGKRDRYITVLQITGNADDRLKIVLIPEFSPDDPSVNTPVFESMFIQDISKLNSRWVGEQIIGSALLTSPSREGLV